MEICGYSYSFGGMLERVKVDNVAVVRFFRDLGLGKMEIYDPFLEDDEIPAVVDALGEADMTVAVVDVELDVVSRDTEVRKVRTEMFQQRLELSAKRLAARHVLILPGLPALDSGFSVDECQEWMKVAIDECLPVARELGITFVLANLGFRADIYGKSSALISLCEDFPELRLTYDVGNFLMAGEDSVEALDKVYSHVVHVHFKDWEIVAQERPGAWTGIDGRLFCGRALGEGIVDLPGVTRRLRELNYIGTISVEYEGLDDPWEAVSQGIGYLRTLL